MGIGGFIKKKMDDSKESQKEKRFMDQLEERNYKDELWEARRTEALASAKRRAKETAQREYGKSPKSASGRTLNWFGMETSGGQTPRRHRSQRRRKYGRYYGKPRKRSHRRSRRGFTPMSLFDM